ncbi:MAG: exo-beta-N-acetylmuramidase NamZ domain-containing protein, partial [Candidatus Sulfotelmatobacter sp.]
YVGVTIKPLEEIYKLKPSYEPGTRFVYSDVGFIVAAEIVRRVSGKRIDAFARENIFAPLGMKDTRYLPIAQGPGAGGRGPEELGAEVGGDGMQRDESNKRAISTRPLAPDPWPLPRIAPTEMREGRWMRGEVHDPRSYEMGGVAGHAGLFSTADDLALFCQMILNKGELNGVRLLAPYTVERMLSAHTLPTAQMRGIGWDVNTSFSSNRGDLLPVGSFGHTGFTGTSIWIDPTTKSYVILLTNSVHPRGKGNAIGLRVKVATEIAAALPLTVEEKDALRWQSITGYNEAMSAERRMSARNGSVKNGIDVLEEHGFDVLKAAEGKKHIGLVTNQTGVDASGKRTIDVLAAAPGISLDAIFSPEHGVTGTLDTTDINNSKDAATSVPVYSVYGATDAARRPPPEVLRTLDAIVFDIQDAGVRFYTYESTLGYFLEAAAKAGIEMIVLDRPDPVTGSFVQGPQTDAGHESFTNYWTVPMRHGMTMGELAKMFNAERGINAKLTVVQMDGWQRGDWFDSTGIEWVNPSPNLRSVTEAALYPGVGLIEGTNISVGRGTDTPFELVGAPWIKSKEFAAYLNERGIAGVRFVPVTFTPTSSNYSGQACQGVNIVLTDRNGFDGPEMGMELAAALLKLYPSNWKIEKMQQLLVNQGVYDALATGQDPRRISQDWREELQKFQKVREKYLIYK